ncbi:fatty acyl-AMP ligase [Mycobacterium sp. 21AC1]|uniref:fatty acyl-AMP ligase n=1 Tax=[Mycobacterium] appelbergii TaxID=2939269 RepID=UPI0029392599|nr:fatty acyl-AMP ligase [Mycobacterium sp. 21AC1]MDV3126413.1 fatty acyl-AMP ligase [Mycobacterium sp. 21AC1]
MARGPAQQEPGRSGLIQIEECLDAEGGITLPPGATLVSLIDRNIAGVPDTVAYRYLDYTSTADGEVTELTWARLGVRLRAVAARVQSVASFGDRVAIVAPQGLEYIVGFFAAIKAGTIAVPLFTPELPGQAERLDTALRDAEPAVVLTTAAAVDAVGDFLNTLPDVRMPQIVVMDEVPDPAGEMFVPVEVDVNDISHLQYTSGSTRPPVGVALSHRAVGTNLLQMILSIDLLDRNTHGLSWLPLYHDMGLSMIGFPAVYGGHSTLMSPTAFIRRPQRWIQALSAASKEGRVVTAAPNFAYEWTAQRGIPGPDAHIDLSNVVMIIGSEPVSIDAIRTFNKAFAPYGLPRTALKPSYGIAEATLFVSTIAPDAEATVLYLDREELADGHAVPVAADAPGAVAQVACGQVAYSQWAVIVDPDTGQEVADGRVGEIWLQGNNIGRGYWGMPEETSRTFDARLRSTLPTDSHAAGSSLDGAWLRTGDLGLYFDGELYVTGRIADLITIDGRDHYPQDIEATVADASPLVRRGYVTAFTASAGDPGREHVVIIAERASGTSRADPQPAIEAIHEAVTRRHGVPVTEVRFMPAGGIPRTTSGKLARLACRDQYLSQTPGAR